MTKFKLQDYKNYIKEVKAEQFDYIDYYTYILLHNTDKWLFMSPDKYKNQNKNTIYDNIRFMVLKKLIKQGYTLKVRDNVFILTK